jgi:hypothetical protein
MMLAFHEGWLRCCRRGGVSAAFVLAVVAAISSICAGQITKAKPKAAAAPVAGPIEFVNSYAGSKIQFTLKNSVSPQRYTIETMAGGVALLDYDNDGLLDIFLTNGAEIPSLEKTGEAYWNRLFHNNGDGTFTDVTLKAGVKGVGYSMGVAAGDFDNDGWEDLYVTGVNANQLLHSNGDGTFTDVTAKAGVTGMVPKLGKAWSVAAGWFDYNNDGRLDLLVINYLNYNLKTAKLCVAEGQPAYCSPVDFLGTPEILYRNNGDGTFTDVTESSHLSQLVGKGMGVAFADYDGDGFTDVFISNDTLQNYLLHNNGDGTFSEVGLSAGVAYNAFGNAVAGMGADFRDVDNDGKPDIFETTMFGEGFPLFKNMGDGQFQDVSGAAGMATASGRLTAWGAGIFDFDDDGLKDLFTANADILDNAPLLAHRPFPLPNGLFRNRGGTSFEDVGKSAGASFQVPAAHRGAAFGDLNNDGRVDVVTTVLNGPPEILMNRSENKNHWILFKLVGTKSNRDGLGTRIKITTATGDQYNQAETAVSYNSSSDRRVHFGLGAAAIVDRVELTWPSGVKQTLTGVKADQVITVRENAE